MSCGFDDDGARAGGGVASAVSGDVVDGVGGYFARVEDDVGYERTI